MRVEMLRVILTRRTDCATARDDCNRFAELIWSALSRKRLLCCLIATGHISIKPLFFAYYTG